MGYLGTLRCNGQTLTEQKFSGDFMSKYANAYNQSKAVTLTKEGVLEAMRSIWDSPTTSAAALASTLRNVYEPIYFFQDIIGDSCYYNEYFEDDGKMVGTFRLYPSDHNVNGCYFVFLSERDKQQIDEKTVFYATNYDEYRDLLSQYSIPEEEMGAIQHLQNKFETYKLNCVYDFDQKKFKEMFHVIMGMKSRSDVVAFISVLQKRAAELVQKQQQAYELAQKAEKIFTKILQDMDNGIQYYAAYTDAHTLEMYAMNDQQLFNLHVEDQYPFSSLFESAGTTKWGGECHITSYKEMEYFISLFPTLEQRNKGLEKTIKNLFDQVKASGQPLDFVIGGSY